MANTEPLVQLQITECKSTKPDTAKWSLSVFGFSFTWTQPASNVVLDNPLHCPELGEYMRSTYFARFPLWSRLALGQRLQVSNATAEAGARILKQEESAMPRGSTKLLRLDEFVAARVPTRMAQTRLLVNRVKKNVKRLREEGSSTDASAETDELMAKESWSKRRKQTLKLSDDKQSLVERFVEVAKWRNQIATSSQPASLQRFSNEIASASKQILVNACTLSRGKLSMFQNSSYWPTNDNVVTSIDHWVKIQEAQRAKPCQRDALPIVR